MQYHCAGIGVGPSNLSLASLLHSYQDVSGIFFERKREFSWHEGLQLPGSSLQVLPLKDLVTLSDPRNFFSFISYLYESGRIYQFLNARFDDVPRKEFENYMKWASRQNALLNFSEEVVSVDFADLFIVRTAKRTIRAENVSVAVGTEPHVPDFALPHLGATQFHVGEFARKAGTLARKRIAVVGGGQSGAEAFLNLISREGDRAPHQVTWISRRENFLPMDDSPFTNEYFMPCHSDYFFAQDRSYRESFVRRNVLASDGISERTLRQIYQRIYTLRLIDDQLPAIVLAPDRTVRTVARDGAQWRLAAEHHASGAHDIVHADVVIWATGFRTARMDFLGPLAHRLDREGDEIRIDGDFAARWDGPADRRIFLLNAARQQRGLPDPNLSLMAWRSQRVIDRISGRSVTRRPQHPAFVPWAPAPLPAERQAV